MKITYYFCLLSVIMSISITDLSGQAASHEDSLAIEIDHFLGSVFGPDQPGASIIVTLRGKTVFHKGYGMANMENSVPVDTSSLFNIGSLSKQFTAIAIMTLVEDGMLSIDQSIDQYFPGCPDYYSKISIRQLLNHTSGLKNYTEIPIVRQNIAKSTSPSEMLELLYEQQPDCNPGETFSYNNSGYILLACIIESVTNRPFGEYITERLFTPAGMNNTFFDDDRTVFRGRVSGYEMADGKITRSRPMSMSHTFGGGTIISNTGDLGRWMEALTSGRIISLQNLQECFSESSLKDGARVGYGLGFYIGGHGPTYHIYHGGGVFGFVSFFIYMPGEDLYVALLRNVIDFRTRNPAGMITSRVAYIASEQMRTRPTITMTESELQNYTGIYRLQNGSTRRIRLDKDKLYFESPPLEDGKPWSQNELIPSSSTIFFVRGSMSHFSFILGDKGLPQGFEVVQPAGGPSIKGKIVN